MTQEQDASNWQSLQSYKALRAEKERRESVAQQWGQELARISSGLSSCGGLLPKIDFSAYPEKRDVLEAQRELQLLNEQIASIRRQLNDTGMGNLI